jgi:membrane protease subunit HflK
MSQSERPSIRPVLLVLGAMFAFSMMALFTREAGANVLGVAAWRAVIVALIFGVWAVAKEGKDTALKPSPTTWKLGAWLGLALAIASSTFVGGYAFTTVANTIFLHNLAPIVVFPLAWWLFQERSHAAALSGAGIALVGVALLSGVSFFQVAHFANARFIIGDLLAIISALGYAAVLTLTRLTRRENTPILTTLFVSWSVAAVILVAVALVFGGLWIPGSAVLWIVGLAVVSTNIPFYLLNLGMRQVSAGMAAVLSLSEVVFATLLGMIVYGEHLAPIGWIGAVLAGLGVLYAVSQHDRPADGVIDASVNTLTLNAQTQKARLGRVFLGLLLLNSGVAITLTTGGSTAPLLAIAGLLVLARFGPGLTTVWLEGRFARPLRWGGTAIAAMAASACFMRAGTLNIAPFSLVSLVAILALGADAWLLRIEPKEERDFQPMLTLGLATLVAAHVAHGIGHGMHDVLAEIANFALGWASIGLLLGGLGGGLLRASPGETGVIRWFEGVAWTLGRGRRPALIAVSLWLAGAVRVVPTGSVGIIERFGEPLSQTGGAGLVVRLPPPFERVTTVDTSQVRRVSMIDGDQAFLTGDHSLIDLAGVVHYRVRDPERYAYGVAAPEEVLAATARAALIEIVIRRSQDAVLTTGRAEVEQAVLRLTQQRAEALELGVEILALNLNRTAVPAPVLAAFLDVISADEERLTAINTAEAYAADAIPVARGEALATVLRAQGERATIAAQSAGASSWFTAVSDGGERSPALTRTRLTWESLEKQLSAAKLVLAPSNVRVWWGRENARTPVDVPDKDRDRSEP